MYDAFIYDWSIDENKQLKNFNGGKYNFVNTVNHTHIRIWALNKQNETICLHIKDFNPYVYIELPQDIDWSNKSYFYRICETVDNICNWSTYKPIHKELVKKKKLYYANLDKNNNYKLFYFLKLTFKHSKHINSMKYKLKESDNIMNVIGIGNIDVKFHEFSANPILQLTSLQNIPTAGWISFKGNEIIEENCDTYCNKEFNVKYKNIIKNDRIDIIPQPYVLSFDIEVNSNNIHRFPTGEHINDKIFQISCVFFVQGTNKYERILLTLGTPTPIKNTTIITYTNETSLLMGFKKLVIDYNPQLIIGYNILNFDIPYMIKRSQKICNCFDKFSRLSCIKNYNCSIKQIKWSSSAYRNQEFEFLLTPGRLFIDLLPIVRRDYKFDNYTLKLVSTFFLGETKDPLDHKDIFRGYRMGMIGDEKGNKMLGRVGKYCIQDSVLVGKLFEKIQTWVGLFEMAKTCNVPIIYIFTMGQQIKVYSQVYKLCLHDNFVVENEGYIPEDDEQYTGATVFPPVPGLYEKVIPFDFASLYPTTIIAYNIDYSTLVTDDNIPDEMCNVIEWEDHVGCEHDKDDKVGKFNQVLCAKRRYRFLKEPKGVMPTLLELLLNTRKKTKNEMKQIKKRIKEEDLDEETKNNLIKKCIVLDKRQLAYKVSANSMYGSMGVKRGYLPFMPGAMCTTAKGRQSIEKAANAIQNYHNGKLVYGDTDSCYIHFPHLKTSEDCWDYALRVEESVSNLFPSPMKLEFEEEIYWRFFILSKKRYMAISCGRDGVLSDHIEKKGVLLARRDNSKFVRDLYGQIIMMIFDGKSKDETLYFIVKYLNDLCNGKFGYKDFIITKLVGDINDYKIRELPLDFKKRVKRLQDLDIDLHPSYHVHNPDNCSICKKEYEMYKLKCLPAHIQLSEKMKRRGKNVEPGSRIEYLVSVGNGHNSKQYDKLEDPKYQQLYKDVVKIDYLHYLKTSCPPIDQILSVGFGIEDFMKNQYKLRINKTNYEECIKKYEQNYTTIYDNIHNKELFIIEFNNNLVKFI